MDREEKNLRKSKSLEPEVFLQWGNRKRLRCVRVKDPQTSQKSSGIIPRRIASRFLDIESSPISQTNRFTRNLEGATVRSGAIESRRASSLSPEKEDRYYTTRGSAVAMVDETGKVSVESNNGGEGKGVVWPKLYITLSSKEKEEDFMAMKGCKPPQRPKKRAKVIQRSLLLVSPGAWLTDMCQERYEVREKKSSKKRPRGLKAMGGSMDSDSEQ